MIKAFVSTVARSEEMNAIRYAIYNSTGYEVVTRESGLTPKDCDIFVCAITPTLGVKEDNDGNGGSVVLNEIKEAYATGMFRLMACNYRVRFGHSYCRKVQSFNKKRDKAMHEKDCNHVVKTDEEYVNDSLLEMDVLSRLSIEAYRFAVLDDQEGKVADRKGNWVHEYKKQSELSEFVAFQLQDTQRIAEIVDRWRTH